MNVDGIIRSATLLLVLLNPFLLSVYLLDVFRRLDATTFTAVMLRGAAISMAVFLLFGWLGEDVFRDVLQVRFASFLVFGGVIFLIVGVRFVFQGPEAVELLRGEPEHVAGSVAMPFMIGPGTIYASIHTGYRLAFPDAAIAIVSAVLVTVVVVIVLKRVYDWVKERNEALVSRYVDLCGRISALVIGTFAVEMIFLGIEQWLKSNGT
jgi:small neutral amino acid transporter SnatA (MarC family)